MAKKCIFRHEFDKNCSKSQFHERKKMFQFFFLFTQKSDSNRISEIEDHMS